MSVLEDEGPGRQTFIVISGSVSGVNAGVGSCRDLLGAACWSAFAMGVLAVVVGCVVVVRLIASKGNDLALWWARGVVILNGLGRFCHFVSVWRRIA